MWKKMMKHLLAIGLLGFWKPKSATPKRQTPKDAQEQAPAFFTQDTEGQMALKVEGSACLIWSGSAIDGYQWTNPANWVSATNTRPEPSDQVKFAKQPR
jgi:hypothetical protein